MTSASSAPVSTATTPSSARARGRSRPSGSARADAGCAAPRRAACPGTAKSLVNVALPVSSAGSSRRLMSRPIHGRVSTAIAVLPRLDRVDDVLVARAAAEVARQRGADLLLVGAAGCARAARTRSSASPACRTRTAGPGAPRTRPAADASRAPSARPSTVVHLAAVGLDGEHQARAHRLAVDASPCTSRTRPARSRGSCRSARDPRAGSPRAAAAARPRRDAAAVDGQLDRPDVRVHHALPPLRALAARSARSTTTPARCRRCSRGGVQVRARLRDRVAGGGTGGREGLGARLGADQPVDVDAHRHVADAAQRDARAGDACRRRPARARPPRPPAPSPRLRAETS